MHMHSSDAHSASIKVIVDLVPNHTSWDHEWFIEALAAAPEARHENATSSAKEANGELRQQIGRQCLGAHWTRCGWTMASPPVRYQPTRSQLAPPRGSAEFATFRFWIDLGVDGFRVDVAHGLIKDLSFPDLDLAAKSHCRTYR